MFYNYIKKHIRVSIPGKSGILGCGKISLRKQAEKSKRLKAD